jgi:tRNA/rRNA methyltransferase
MPTSIVLVSPLFAGNLGSVARAMKNMGLKDLRLVLPQADPKDLEARKMAAHAKDILSKAKTFKNLKSALKGFDLVVGTSRRKGKERSNWRSPRQFAEEVQSFPPKHKIAILFGREDTGLTNQEISLCHRIVTIPSHKSFASLNLAQAVMVLAYELFLAKQRRRLSKGLAAAEASVKPAKLQHLEAMYEDLGTLLGEVGFLNKQNPHRLMRLIRNLFNRARPTEKEVRIFRGICRQVRWWGKRD